MNLTKLVKADGYVYLNENREVVDEMPDRGWFITQDEHGVVRRLRLLDSNPENPETMETWFRTDL